MDGRYVAFGGVLYGEKEKDASVLSKMKKITVGERNLVFDWENG